MVLWLLIGVAGLFTLLYAYRLQGWRRVIRRTPTLGSDEIAMRATVNGGARCEVVGLTQAGYSGLLHAPLSGRSCVWYRVRVLARERSRFGQPIPRLPHPALDVTSPDPFTIRDAAGTVRVDPDGADVRAGRRTFLEKAWAPSMPSKPAAHPLTTWAQRIADAGYELRLETGFTYYVREWILFPTQQVYALGNAGYDHQSREYVVRCSPGELYFIGAGTERSVVRDLTRKLVLSYGCGASLIIIGFGGMIFSLVVWFIL